MLVRGLSLESALPGVDAALPPPDRGLARALASGALRWLVDLDALIDSATARPVPPDARARMVLRVALTGALVLGTPPHAAVATALPLVEGGPRRLVHGVLGKLLRGGARLPDAPALPEPWASRWAGRYGAEAAAAAAREWAHEAPLDLTLRNPAATADWAARLGAVSLWPGQLRLPVEHDRVPELAGFAEGAWWVQDLASSLPATLLGARAGETVLDLCAAPGGKTLQLAATGARVTAVDSSAARSERLRGNLARTGLVADVVVADLLTWAPPALADAILLDAPCSATGIYRRHPDVLHLRRAKDLPALAGLQAKLLERAIGWLKPGGRLVFAICSLEPEEGEAHAIRLAADSRLSPSPLADGDAPDGAATAEGWLRTRPGLLEEAGGMAGFFAARWTRV